MRLTRFIGDDDWETFRKVDQFHQCIRLPERRYPESVVEAIGAPRMYTPRVFRRQEWVNMYGGRETLYVEEGEELTAKRLAKFPSLTIGEDREKLLKDIKKIVWEAKGTRGGALVEMFTSMETVDRIARLLHKAGISDEKEIG